MFGFIVFTVFLAYNPSPQSSTPLFPNIFDTITTISTTNSSSLEFSSKLSPVLSYFFPNVTQPNINTQNKDLGKVGNFSPTKTISEAPKSHFVNYQTQTQDLGDKVGVLMTNQSVVFAPKSSVTVNQNQTVNSLPNASEGKQNDESDKLVKNLMNCDLFHGEWVRDDSYPLYKPGSCSLIDEQFNCYLNGRPDKGFQQMKWKPRDCTLPRFVFLTLIMNNKNIQFQGYSFIKVLLYIDIT